MPSEPIEEIVKPEIDNAIADPIAGVEENIDVSPEDVPVPPVAINVEEPDSEDVSESAGGYIIVASVVAVLVSVFWLSIILWFRKHRQ